jgi:hypothetical protein
MDSDIVYPVVLLAKDGVWVARDSEELTTTQRLLLRAGLYDDQLLVDSVGRRRHLKGARELGARVGFLGRWREFWRPSAPIKVELFFDSDFTSVSVDELKERVLKSLAGPSSRRFLEPGSIKFEELKEGLKTSKTYDAVLHLVRECTTIPPELR